jgi:hypothetical protein
MNMNALKKVHPTSGRMAQLVIENSALREKLANNDTDLNSFIFGKVSPQALELEEVVIGACLMDTTVFPLSLKLYRRRIFMTNAIRLFFRQCNRCLKKTNRLIF